MSELWSLPASEVARLVRARKASAREVADSGLRRLGSVNPRITAIVDCRSYREDLCLCAGEAIEARGTPPAPIDPRN
jgi:amidase